MDLEAQSLLLDGEDRFETGSRSETQIGFFGVAGCGSVKLIRNLLQQSAVAIANGFLRLRRVLAGQRRCAAATAHSSKSCVFCGGCADLSFSSWQLAELVPLGNYSCSTLFGIWLIFASWNRSFQRGCGSQFQAEGTTHFDPQSYGVVHSIDGRGAVRFAE